jgi:hypothetical protein
MPAVLSCEFLAVGVLLAAPAGKRADQGELVLRERWWPRTGEMSGALFVGESGTPSFSKVGRFVFNALGDLGTPSLFRKYERMGEEAVGLLVVNGDYKARISHAFPLHTAMAVDKGSILTCGGDCELVDEGERPGRTAESADDCEAERSRLMGMGVDGVGLDDMGDWCGLKVRC